MARQIASAPLKPDICMPVLVGGFVFAADLLRALALPRFYHMRGTAAQMAGRIADFQEGAYVALGKLSDWLATHDWLVDNCYTIADIGMFGYVSLAPEGGYDMQRFPAIRAWLARVKAQPGWVPLVEEA